MTNNPKSKPKEDLLINYSKFTIDGKPITQMDVWTIMCKYNAKYPKDKKFEKLIDEGLRLLT